MRVSYSQINSAAACGERFRLERVLKVPQRPAWALVGGSAFHNMTEDFDRGHAVEPFDNYLDAEIERRLEEAPNFDRDEWRASGRATKEWPLKEDERWWRYHGPLFFDRYVRWSSAVPWVVAEIGGEPAVELEIRHDFGGGVEFVGYVDRVYHDPRHDVLIVVDHKSGSYKPVTPRQLAFYAELLGREYDVEINLGAFYDARSGSTGEVKDLSLYDYNRIEYQARALALMRERGIYLANPGTLCASCSVKDFCFEYSGADAIEVPPPYLHEPPQPSEESD